MKRAFVVGIVNCERNMIGIGAVIVLSEECTVPLWYSPPPANARSIVAL